MRKTRCALVWDIRTCFAAGITVRALKVRKGHTDVYWALIVAIALIEEGVCAVLISIT
jgi:hypothetical protein